MSSLQRFTNRKVIITGAGSGIGQATVARLLSEGAAVVAMDVSEAGLAATAQAAQAAGAQDRLTTLTVNVGDEASLKAGIASALKTLGGLDVLVNAAGVLRTSHTADTSLAFWDEVIRINLTGTFLATREALPALLASGAGVVVNFSSTSANFAHPYMAAYAASKGGIQAFTHAIALEYCKEGLRAVSLVPGGIASGMTGGITLPEDADYSLLAKLSPSSGQGFGKPESVASIIAMLASEDGVFITGTEIRVDGGTHM